MKYKKLLIILVIFAFPSYGSTWLTRNDINLTFYNSMPRMFKMDNFDECSQVFQPVEFPKQYCIVSVNLFAKSNTDLIKGIKKFSSSSKNFNHAKSLKYAVCMSHCLMVHNHLKDKYVKYMNDHESVSDKPFVEGRIVMFNKISNVCINKELMDYYGLIAETKIDYCIYNDTVDFDLLIDLYYISLIGLFFTVLIAVIYEHFKNHPKVEIRLKNWRRIRNFLSAYSIKQNWQSLINNENTSSDLELDNDDENISQLYIIKVILMFLFVFTQVYRQIASMPFANPLYVEQTHNTFLYNLYNEQSVINSFFTISGIFASYSLIPYIRKSKINVFRMLWNIFNTRQDLIFSITLASILLHSSVFSKWSNNPFWMHSSLYEKENCINNWRYNLLSGQNYVNTDEMCMEPTWIFAAELHLILIGFVVLFVAEKVKSYSKYLFGLTVISSVVLVASRIYFHKLNPLAMITPEILRNNHLIKSPKLQEIFYSTHMNAGNFIIGLIFGYLLYNKVNLDKFKSRIIYIVSLLYYFLIPAVLKYFFEDKPTFITTFVGTYLKHHDGIILSVILLNFLSVKEDSCCRRLLKLPIYKVLDKLFYPMFFSQLIVTKYFLADAKTLIEISLANLFAYSCAIFVTSYALATIVHLTIQAPLIKLRSSTDEAEMVDESKKAEEKPEQKKTQ